MQDAERLALESLGRILGVFWDSQTVHSSAGTLKSTKGASPVDYDRGFWIPLSVLLSHINLVKELAKTVPLPGKSGQKMIIAAGEYQQGDDEEIMDVSELGKSQFFDFLHKSGIYPGWSPKRPDAESQLENGPKDSEVDAEQERRSTPISVTSKEEFRGRLRQSGIGVRAPQRILPPPEDE